MKRCKENGVELRMYISPDFSQKSALTTAAAEEIGSVAMSNKVSFTNAHFEEYFMQDATLFKDASHLNDKGARMFTANVVCDIILQWNDIYNGSGYLQFSHDNFDLER